MFVKTIHLLTKQYVQFQVITPEVEKIVGHWPARVLYVGEAEPEGSLIPA